MNRRMALIGSSIFEQWTGAAAGFPGWTVLNLAVGGTCTEYWVDHVQTRIDEAAPDAVALYCGSNDINQGIDPGVIIENTFKIRDCVHESNREFLYYAIIKAPQKRGLFTLIDKVNRSVAAALGESGERVVDLNEILCQDVADISGLYVEDGLHLTDVAYDRINAFNRTALGLNGA